MYIQPNINIENTNNTPDKPAHWNVFIKSHWGIGGSQIVIGSWNPTNEYLNIIKTDTQFMHSENVLSIVTLWNVSFGQAVGNFSESPLPIVKGLYVLQVANITYDSTVFSDTISSNTIPGGV